MGKAMGNFTELDAYLFGQGTHYDIYKKPVSYTHLTLPTKLEV